MSRKRHTFRDRRRGAVQLDIRQFSPRGEYDTHQGYTGHESSMTGASSAGLVSRFKRRIQNLFRRITPD